VAGQEHLGTGSALGVAAFNAFTGVMNPIIGLMVDKQHNYSGAFILFFAMTTVSFIFSIVWNVLDFRSKTRVINAPSPMYGAHEDAVKVAKGIWPDVESNDRDGDDPLVGGDDVDGTDAQPTMRTPVVSSRHSGYQSIPVQSDHAADGL
jgi:hypothetical protein